MQERVLNILQFQEMLSEQLSSAAETKYHFLVGAGFSYSASIPTAHQVAGILAYRKNHPRTQEDIRSIIRLSLQNGIKTEKEIAKLRQSTPALADADYPRIYSRLLSDPKLFPGAKISRQEFIEALLSVASEHSFGYNHESLYLAYLCEHWRNKVPKIQTILTTNFDDVLPASFAKIGSTCRLLERTDAIARETWNSKYPRIAYLHGRFVDYDLVNTESEIQRTLAQSKQPAKQDSSHGEAIAEFINMISTNSALIVIGYAGWEDAIMETLARVLSSNGFPAGLFWCCRGRFESLRPNTQRLFNENGHMYVIENCTALDVMRAALEASGIPETVVVETVRNAASKTSENFEKRWVQIEHYRHGFRTPCLSLEERKDRVRLPDPESILERIDRAALDSRNSRLALEFVQVALRQAHLYTRPLQARLFQGRADLLARYSPQIEQAISDYHWALRLGTDRQAEAWLGLSECYLSIGDAHYASLSLRRAYRLARETGQKVAVGLCLLASGTRLYDDNKLKKAMARIESAAKIFEQEGKLDLRAKCHYQLGALLLFNNQSGQALAKAQLTRDDALKAGYRVGESEAEFLRGQIYVYLNQLELAQESLERAFNIAQEGPHFRLLGNIALFWADIHMKSGKPADAVAMEEEAMRLYGLSGRTKGYATAKALRDSYKIHGEPRLDLALFKAAEQSALELEDCGDKSVSVVLWATLGTACLLKDGIPGGTELANQALKRCRKLAADFAVDIGRTSEDGPLGFKDPDLRLNAHVQEYATLFEILAILRKEPHELQPETKRYIKRKYHEFRSNHAVHNYASPESEVMAAVVSFLIFKKRLYSFKELVSFDESIQKEDQLTPETLRAFCNKKGFWQYGGFLD